MQDGSLTRFPGLTFAQVSQLIIAPVRAARVLVVNRSRRASGPRFVTLEICERYRRINTSILHYDQKEIRETKFFSSRSKARSVGTGRVRPPRVVHLARSPGRIAKRVTSERSVQATGREPRNS